MIKTLKSVVSFAPIETDLVARRLARAACIEDLRKIAKRRLPGGVFDYIDGAAEDEVTYAGNTSAFADIRLEPRVLRDVSEIDISTTVLGKKYPSAVFLAPTGFTRIADPEGEVAVARAAAKRGVVYSLSTMATRSIEEVAAAGEGPKWFQVYVWKNRDLVRRMIERAEAAGYEALLVTVDTVVLGRRERDVRRGFALPPKLGLGTLIDGGLHPGWSWDFIRSDPISFANIVNDPTRDGSSAVALSSYVGMQFDPALSWADIEWIRSITSLPVLLKGVGSVEDVRQAAREGIPAVVVGNHGGRQLDGAPPSLSLVASSVQAVGDEMEILVDGGVRRGRDVVAARALGARAVLVGRPYLYGLGAAGERGVLWVIDHLHEGIDRTLALVGLTSFDAVDESVLYSPHARQEV